MTEIASSEYDKLTPLSQAYPDVSAQSDNFRIFLGGRPGLIGGTSASCPTFAGFVSLLNDVRIRAGKSSLGFINPLVYSLGLDHSGAFNDITTGNNPGCGTPGFNVGTSPLPQASYTEYSVHRLRLDGMPSLASVHPTSAF